MKRAKMEDDVTYLLCPDKTCKLFWDINSRHVPCESRCPHQDKLIKMIICRRCHEIIELSGDHFSWCRIDHKCPDGGGCMNFEGMSGKYQLLYKKPK